MHRHRLIPLPLVLALALAGEVVAQDHQPVGRGDRVRVWAPAVAADVLEGVVIARSDSGLTILSEAASKDIALPWQEIQELHRNRGSGNRALAGTLVGGGLGAAFATLFAVAFCGDADTSCQADEVALVFAVFALPPAGAGALIGSLLRYEKWERVPLVQPGLVVRRLEGRGIGIGLQLPLP